MGKLTISMAIFHSYVKLPEGIQQEKLMDSLLDMPQGHETGSKHDGFPPPPTLQEACLNIRAYPQIVSWRS